MSGRDGTPERVEAQKPRPGGPALRFGGWGNRREKRYVGPSVRKRPDTFQEEQAPKGESQERRRDETNPARARME